MIERIIRKELGRHLNSKKAIVIMGARQVGKSTLMHQMFDGNDDVLWLNGDEPDISSMLAKATSTRLRAIIGNKRIVIIDEAQRIPEIGLKLKLIIDELPEVKIIATGSSSFDLANKLSEPLTGRKREYTMFPITFEEMVNHTGFIEETRMTPHRMIYGYYPEVVMSPGEEKQILKELSSSYLYKDILSMDSILKTDRLTRLLQALALQIGEQVSYNELGQLVGLDPKTVEKYVEILEKNYVVFRLGTFSRNLRNELKKTRKIYFWDLGIRNAVIGNFSQVEARTDVGAMWENFVIAERLKHHAYSDDMTLHYFWRTQQQQEIDLVEERDGTISAYEFKWNPKRANARMPESFAKAYPTSDYKVITPENVDEILL